MSSSFIPMQDRCGNTERNERNAEKGRGYIRSRVSYAKLCVCFYLCCDTSDIGLSLYHGASSIVKSINK